MYYRYVKNESVENIKNYKYKGIDESIVYNKITSPLCNKIQKFIPDYIA